MTDLEAEQLRDDLDTALEKLETLEQWKHQTDAYYQKTMELQTKLRELSRVQYCHGKAIHGLMVDEPSWCRKALEKARDA